MSSSRSRPWGAARPPRLARLGTVLIALCLSGGPGRGAPAADLRVVDDSNTVIRLGTPARRVITLAPNLTELVAAAGGEKYLVGVSRFSDYPPAVRQLPALSDAFHLNLEAIAQLKPDLVIAWKSGMPERQRQRLAALGIPIFTSEINSVEAIVDTVRRLGVLMGTSNVAQSAAAQIDQSWQDLRRRSHDGAPVRVFYQAWGQPLMTINGEHLISRAVQACGGTNVFASLSILSPTVSWEAALQAHPQLVLTSNQSVADTQALWTRQSAQILPAPPLVVGLSSDLTTRMGPRFVQGAAQICAAIAQARQASGVHTPPTQRQTQP